jgi:hypothetical protein
MPLALRRDSLLVEQEGCHELGLADFVESIGKIEGLRH